MRTKSLAPGVVFLGILSLATPSARASVIDLTTPGASGTIGDAFFVQVAPQPTGTGFIDSFVRVQARGTEEGFNTDLRPLTGDLEDVNHSVRFTRALKVGEFGIVDRDGTASLRFLLDINESLSEPLLSMDEMMVFTAGRGDIGSMADLQGEGTLLYDLDAGGDSHVLLDYSLNHGSGSGDMFAFLPADLFAGKEQEYLYLYSRFGDHETSNAGFEEWARVDGEEPPVIPEPATVMLLGGGLIGAALLRRRRP